MTLKQEQFWQNTITFGLQMFGKWTYPWSQPFTTGGEVGVNSGLQLGGPHTTRWISPKKG